MSNKKSNAMFRNNDAETFHGMSQGRTDLDVFDGPVVLNRIVLADSPCCDSP